MMKQITRISRALIGIMLFGVTVVYAAEPGPLPIPGVTISVTGFAEPVASPDIANCTVVVAGVSVDCPTLREAIMYANNNTDIGTGSQTEDTIVLSAGTYNLTLGGLDETFTATTDPGVLPTVTNVPQAAIGDLDITEALIITGTVDGAGVPTSIIDASGFTIPDRIFHIYDPVEDVYVTINNVIVQNGELVSEEDLGAGPPSEYGDLDTVYKGFRAGGGIAMGAAASAVLYDPNPTGEENSAGRGGSQRPDSEEESGGTYALTLNNVQILTSTTAGDGGGLYNAGALTANNIVIDANTSGKNGGGWYNEGDSTLTDSTVSNNESEGGGGMFATGNPATTVNIRRSTFNDNTAVGGGAMSGRAVTINITNTTISANIGSDVGGGIYSNGVVNILNSTIVDNEASGAEQFGGAGVNLFKSGNAAVTLKNTILSNNTAGAGPRDANCGCTGSQTNCTSGGQRAIDTDGYNLSSDLTCNLDATGDQQNIDPMLDVLADNNTDLPGTTLTHALLTGSPAIDAANNVGCPNNDQRGSIRPADGDGNSSFICDIGAYEVFLVYSDLHINNMTAPDEVDKSDVVPISIEVHNIGTGTATDVALEVSIPTNLTYVSATPDTGTCSYNNTTRVVSCDIGDLADPEMAAVNITTVASTAGDAVVTATVSTTASDPDLTNNTHSVSISINGISDIELTATVDEDTIKVGSNATIRFNVFNKNGDDATGVKVYGTLPSGVTFISATPDFGTCSETGGLVSCTIGDLAFSNSANIVLVLRVDERGTATVTATASADQVDLNLTNNTVSAVVTVTKKSSNGGLCSFDPNAEFDPLLPAIILLSLLYLARRRSRIFGKDVFKDS